MMASREYKKWKHNERKYGATDNSNSSISKETKRSSLNRPGESKDTLGHNENRENMNIDEAAGQEQLEEDDNDKDQAPVIATPGESNESDGEFYY